MNIKNIKKVNNGRYQIIFDDNTKITTYDEVLLKGNLLYKKQLTTKEINEINGLNDYYDIYTKLIKLLNKKMRSEKEIIDYIDKYEVAVKDKEDLINRLKQAGLLNDSRFIKAYVSDRMNLSNDGPYKIKSDLQKYDLDEDEINREIDNISEEDILEKLLKIINKKTKALKGSAYGIKQKIYFDMHNLGYSREMVDKVYNNNEDDSTSLERDYEKVYNSLLKKEKDDNKLYLKIKQKLYQKGYSLSKIDEVLEKKRDN